MESRPKDGYREGTMSKRLLSLCTAILICTALLVGCGAKKEEVKTADLVFSDVKVECSNRDGFFGGRYASFTLKGSVTNKSGNPVNEDNMPKIVAGGDDGEEIRADLSQEKLLDGETCDISYVYEFDITDDPLPTLSFSCKLSVEGLEDAEKELNSGLGKIADSYADKDAKEEAERKAAEEKEQKEKEAAEKAMKAVVACMGKTADEGLKAAKAAGYTATFEDKGGVDVTDDVENANNKSDVHKAKITNVEIISLLDDVTFTLDFEDPETKKAREEEAAEEAEAARKEEEAKMVLNTGNCEDLARLLDLADQGDPFIAEFARKYEGRKIEFDAVILDVQYHGTSSTRYDFLLMAGNGSRGPYLKYEDKRAGYDLHWEGNYPDNVSAGTKLHCIAEVKNYNETQQLLFLNPVETRVR